MHALETLLADFPELPLLAVALVAAVIWRSVRQTLVLVVVGVVLLVIAGIALHEMAAAVRPTLCLAHGSGLAARILTTVEMIDP